VPARRGRIGVLDFLRGFALLGILAVNMPYLAHPLYTGPPETTWLDTAARWLVSFAGEAKFFVLFSFLFGYGFAVQIDSARSKGRPLAGPYGRRLLGLLVIGIAHALFLFMGDILVAYALLGALLWRFKDWSPKRLVWTAGVALIVAMCAYGLLGVLVTSDPSGGPEQLSALADQARLGYLGTWADGTRQRMFDLAVVSPFLWLYYGPSALAMFALGLAAGKARLLAGRAGLPAGMASVWPRLRGALPFALTVGFVGNLAYASLGSDPDSGLWGLFAFMGLAFAGPALSFGYVVGLIGLFESGRMRWLVEPVCSAGRLSLTNYVGQSMIAGVLFNGYGLGWYGSLGAAACLGLSIAIFTVQVALSHAWLRRFRYGPGEWLLRSWTYGRTQPLLARG